MPRDHGPARPTLTGTVGAIASSNWLASAAGMAMLDRGGNAFDAAVAAAFVLQVVEPHQNGPGGDVPILLSEAGSDAVEVICGQGVVPSAATIDLFQDLGLPLIPGTGLLPACVPGALGAWLRLLEENGTLELSDVITDAIRYADGGFPVTRELREVLLEREPMFREHWRSSAQVYMPGQIPEVGDILRNPALGATYRRLVAEAVGASREARIRAAHRAWYEGFVAEKIGAFMANNEVMDETGRRHAGLLTSDDMTGFEAARETSLSLQYRDYIVHKTQTWGQGPVFLQQLALLSGYDITAMAAASPDWVHTIVECAKLAFADREAWYGDPAFVDVPVEGLLSPVYAAQRRSLVSERASTVLRPGSPMGLVPRLPIKLDLDYDSCAAVGREPNAPLGSGGGNGDTCFVAATDRMGNLVAAAPSGGWIMSSPVIPDLGFCLGTRAQMLWLEEGLPNSLEPGKRPRTTLSPTIAFGERTSLAFGSPGGDQQDQWSLLFFLGVVDHGMELHSAIDAPVFHTLHFPNSFFPRQSEPAKLVVEGRIEKGVVTELRRRGHDVEVGGDWSLARTCAVSNDGRRGTVAAGASMRGIQAHAIVR